MNPVDGVSIMKEGARLYGRHAAVVIGGSLMVQTVGVVLTFSLLSNAGMFVGVLGAAIVAMATTQLTLGMCTVLLLHIRQHGDVPTISALVAATLPRVPALMILSLVTGLGIGVGLLLFIAPGVYLLHRWAVAAPALIAGRQSATDAISTSSNLTKEAMGATFMVVGYQLAITLGIPRLSGHVAGGELGAPENYLLALALITGVLLPLPALALAELYFRLIGYTHDPVTGIATLHDVGGPSPEHRVHVPLVAAPAPVMPVASQQPWAPARPPAAPAWSQPNAPAAPTSNDGARANPNYGRNASAVHHTIDCDPLPTAGPAPGLAAPVTNPLAPPASHYVPRPVSATGAGQPAYAQPLREAHAPAPPGPPAPPGAPEPPAAPMAPAPPARTHSVPPPGMA